MEFVWTIGIETTTYPTNEHYVIGDFNYALFDSTISEVLEYEPVCWTA